MRLLVLICLMRRSRGDCQYRWTAFNAIQSDCLDADDDMRWLVALLSDSGMRLGEAVGLVKSDIILDGDIPHVNISPHAWRRLKDKR